ncbi:uncharacterized protein FOMMEDRAFT_166546 [Fomitiporia mediterranea MF3/22]|uniref:uncharacterized protein n=1 Tax=Fomitiporia mediterranea (strain MF3/22) TaxID=694068 RepID=UPI00044086F0|nr:uncharacterized protein FOMMEDRAFT_166546 [Fomitiporia mediterranea MF3/22]EJD04712.1 hypothetical protein FOMMEDRAFT_166546 [Fomitiporia mediterranea MF3/22]
MNHILTDLIDSEHVTASELRSWLCDLTGGSGTPHPVRNETLERRVFGHRVKDCYTNSFIFTELLKSNASAKRTLSMSTAIVLPPLKSWAEQRLTAIISAKTQADFDQAFDNFVAKNVKEILFNGERLSRDQYKDKLQRERFDEVGAVVKVLNSVQAPVLGTQETQQSGLVGLFYDATYVEGIRIRDAAVEHSVQSSLNVRVEQDDTIPLPPAGIHGFVERRRVFSLNQVYVDQKGEISGITGSS